MATKAKRSKKVVAPEAEEPEVENGDAAESVQEKPKRPPTAYFAFLADFRIEMAGKKQEGGQKIPSLAGARWREMTDEEKEPYLKQVAVLKKAYEKKMEVWTKQNPK